MEKNIQLPNKEILKSTKLELAPYDKSYKIWLNLTVKSRAFGEQFPKAGHDTLGTTPHISFLRRLKIIIYIIYMINDATVIKWISDTV